MKKSFKIPTATQARKMKKEDLIALALNLGIENEKVEDQKQWVVLEYVIEELRNRREQKRNAPVELNKTQQKVVDSELTKAEKIRQLHSKNLKPSQISKVLDAHISFVYSTLARAEAKKVVAESNPTSIIQEVPAPTATPAPKKAVTKNKVVS